MIPDLPPPHSLPPEAPMRAAFCGIAVIRDLFVKLLF